MGRLRSEFLDRCEAFSHRVVDVAEALEGKCRWNRILDQLVGAGTSVSANIFEADEAMSVKEFIKCVSISARELNEARFWLRFVSKRGWIGAKRLGPLMNENEQLRKIIGTIIRKSKAAGKSRSRPS